MQMAFLTNKQRGHAIEQQVADYLQQQGVKILAQNFYCKGGEIDLIGWDHNTLVFIEVKYRQNNQHGSPSEFINSKKLYRLYKCAQVFLLKNQHYQQAMMRFDSIAVTSEPARLDWQKNIYNGW